MSLMNCAFVSFIATIVSFIVLVLMIIIEIKTSSFDNYITSLKKALVLCTKSSFFLTCAIFIIAILK